MASKLSIRGKQLVVLCPKAHVKYVSLVFFDNRTSPNSIKSLKGYSLVGQNQRFLRHISVVYISVRLIISATWVRQMPLSFDTETNSNFNSKLKPDSKTTDEGFLHENMFVFDKAFAQEIKYLFAELDFDLYMCRDKQGEVKRRQAVSRRIPVWRPKEQYNTLVYFVRQNEKSNGIRCGEQEKNVGNCSEQIELNQVLETFGDKLKNEGRNSNTYTEGNRKDISVEAYLQQFKAEDITVAAGLKSVRAKKHGREDLTIEDYLCLCEEERLNKDINVEDYLRLLEEGEISDDVTVEDYLSCWEEEQNKNGINVEDYLRLLEEKKACMDVEDEEYLTLCKESEHSQDIEIEEYLRLCKEEEEASELTVEEYLRSCEEQREKNGMNVEEYLRLCEEAKVSTELTVEEYSKSYEEERGINDITIEEYLRLAGEELSQGVTVEEYLKLCGKGCASTELTVDEYLALCEKERKGDDITVEEYLRLVQEELSQDTTVEEYLRLVQEELSQDTTVEEYLRLCKEIKAAMELTVEEYLRLCEEEKERDGVTTEDYLRLIEEENSQGMTVGKFLRLHEKYQDKNEMTVKEYINLVQDDRLSDGFPVEEYLNLYKEEHGCKGVTVEKYLELCEEERLAKGMTVEEYLKLFEEEQRKKDMTVEEYLRLCEDNRRVKDLTVEEYLELYTAEGDLSSSKEVSIEEYLRLCEQERPDEDTSVEEFLRLCKEQRETKHLSIEDYLKHCELERAKELTIEQYIRLFQEDLANQKTCGEGDEISDGLKRALFGDFKQENREFYNVSEEILPSENVNKNLRDDKMVPREAADLDYIGSLFLPTISLCRDLDNDLEIASAKGQAGNQFESEEEQIIESFVSQAESSIENWMTFETLGMGETENHSQRTRIAEEFISEDFVINSNENGMEAVLERHGLTFFAELWLLFPSYRRNPWFNISVLYRDNVHFDWGISHVIETEAGDRISLQGFETKNVFEEETGDFSSIGASECCVVEEEEVVMSEMASNFAEIEFSRFDCDENEDNNNTMAYSNGFEKGNENQRLPAHLPKKMIAPALKQPRYHASDEQLNGSKNINFAALTDLSKKGFVYRSKERIFTGGEADNKSIWNNLEKIRCKHAKTINVPETLRRTVSRNSLDILESSNEDETTVQVRNDTENEVPNTLMISPLRIENLGKNLRESNV